MFRGLEVDAELLTEPRALRKSYLDALERFVRQVRKDCAASNIDYVQISTAEPLDAALSRYLVFRQRATRREAKSLMQVISNQ